MKQRALLLVDLQNDFCAGGALAVAEGDSTVDVANTLIDWCKSRGEAVVASQDWHPANHGSFASQHGVVLLVGSGGSIRIQRIAAVDRIPRRRVPIAICNRQKKVETPLDGGDAGDRRCRRRHRSEGAVRGSHRALRASASRARCRHRPRCVAPSSRIPSWKDDTPHGAFPGWDLRPGVMT